MMKPVRQRIEVVRWDEGEAFVFSARPMAKAARSMTEATARRRRSAHALFRPETGPLGLLNPPGGCSPRRPWRWWAMVALVMGSGPLVCAQVTNSPAAAARPETNYSARLDFSSFKIVADRNIFNSARSARSARSGGEPQKQAKVDSFSLVGTMTSEKGRFAFFDGTSAEYRKVLKSEGAIAGYKITDIAPARVKLGLDGKEVELRVGMQMRRQDEGEWQQVAQAGSFAASSRATVSTQADSSKAGDPDAGGDESEVLKRLLQKREAEDNK